MDMVKTSPIFFMNHRRDSVIVDSNWNILMEKNNSPRPYQQTPVSHTPNPQPTVYERIPFIWGFGDVWGMLQGYVGFPLEIRMRLENECLVPDGHPFFFLVGYQLDSIPNLDFHKKWVGNHSPFPSIKNWLFRVV